MTNIFFDKNIFAENVYGKRTSLSHAHALLSTPYIQLPPLLFEVEGGDETKRNEGLMDRTHTRTVSFIVLDLGQRDS